jgi:Fe2+ transport system protein FeoA
MHDLLPLCLLKIGETAVIRHIAGADDHVHRLREMGLHDGTSIEMLQSGSPCIVKIAGHKLCFRDDDVTRVLVEPDRVP